MDEPHYGAKYTPPTYFLILWNGQFGPHVARVDSISNDLFDELLTDGVNVTVLGIFDTGYSTRILALIGPVLEACEWYAIPKL